MGPVLSACAREAAWPMALALLAASTPGPIAYNSVVPAPGAVFETSGLDDFSGFRYPIYWIIMIIVDYMLRNSLGYSNNPIGQSLKNQSIYTVMD